MREANIDPALVDRAVRDREAAGELLQRLLPRVRNLVRYLVRGDGEVDDMAQQGLIAILKGLPSYRGDAPVERWADRIVARTVFAHLRRERRENEKRRVLALVPDPEAAPTGYGLRRDLVRWLDGLPEAQRDALVLHHVVGLTTPELAEWLGVSAETAKSRLRLGMQKLRERLGSDSEVAS
ncbi:MAG TPA: sigma-70 family RNA polymerase sigma factor [Myxococcales bacterium LLY-WYZ-16_1]|nr:sigma-70 family RNA polymerase sigma factor [Myxococcales bacterium LLY-WYZ-16_1]